MHERWLAIVGCEHLDAHMSKHSYMEIGTKVMKEIMIILIAGNIFVMEFITQSL
jgi:hypothetical protein